MVMIHGITVTLIDRVKTGEDPFGRETWEEREIPVSNVLVSPTLPDEAVNQMNIYGRKAEYTLGIPKGDTHDWENKEVIFFDQRFKTFGIPTQGIEDMIPLEWNKKVMVERYE